MIILLFLVIWTQRYLMDFLEQFCASYNLKRLIVTCFWSVDNSSYIDLILTITRSAFKTLVYEIGKSGLDELTFTALKFSESKSRIIKYRDYKHFDKNEFSDELILELSSNSPHSDYLAQFTNIPKMIFERRHLWKRKVCQI